MTQPDVKPSADKAAMRRAIVAGPVGAVLGAVVAAGLTWWLMRPTPTVLFYSDSATIRHDVGGLSDLVPGLMLTLDGEPSALVYREVRLWAAGGEPRDRAELAFSLSSSDDVRIFFETDVPSSLFDFECEKVGHELKCGLGPINPEHADEFVLRLASEVEQPLEPRVAAGGLRLETAFAGGPRWQPFLGGFLTAVVGSLSLLLRNWLRGLLRDERVTEAPPQGNPFVGLQTTADDTAAAGRGSSASNGSSPTTER